MKHIKKFEAIDHSKIDPFNEEKWDDYSKLLNDNGYEVDMIMPQKKIYIKKFLDTHIGLTIMEIDSKTNLFDFKYFFVKKSPIGNINSIFKAEIRVYDIDEDRIYKIEQEFTKIKTNSENV